MTVTIARSRQDLEGSQIVIVPVFTDDDFDDLSAAGLNLVSDNPDVFGQSLVAAKRYEVTALFQTSPGAVLLIQAGPRSRFEPLVAMHVIAAASRYLTARGMGDMAVLDRGIFPPQEFGRAAVEGCYRGAYDAMLRRATKPSDGRVAVQSVALLSDRDEDALLQGANLGQVIAESAAVARDLVNLPANEVTPSSFADRASELAADAGLRFAVLGPGEMLEMGMGSLLAVADGSDEEPRLFSVSYGNPDASVRLALVGKGITFDSGGLSLKTAEGMETMKCDMGGGAAVLAGILAISRLQIPNILVTAYVGATENMPSGHAMRPGDIVTAMTGETIEILNTDAEGRLVLADVLAYAEQQGATHIVDFATLTGGAVVALGHASSLTAGKPFEWVQTVTSAANGAMERAWAMPLFPEYRAAMDSDIADIKNSGGRPASSLTAASFLADFVTDVPWTHVDIAGTAFETNQKPYRPAGGTGVGVATIVEVARLLSAERARSQ